jgi:glycosyltransferase involved in cell wall biosynthesis
VADRVKFIGFISDKERNQLFKVADCSIFPSLYEPFGIVALEAMALGCPLVVSDVGGFAEVVRHAETGIKIYPDNVESTAWGIVHALSHPDWARKHTIKARQSVEKHFNWPHIAGLTINVYHRILAEC